MRPYCRVSASSISALEKTLSVDQWVAPPTSMYSMNRTSALICLPNSSRSTSSSSLTPRMMTLSIFNPLKPARWAALIPFSTFAWESFRVSAIKRSGRSVSRLTVTRCRPASYSAFADSANNNPFVVIAKSSIRGLRAIIPTKAERSRRTSGSPPVRRTLVTPSSAKMSTRRLASSNVRMPLRGSQTYSSSGIQY